MATKKPTVKTSGKSHGKTIGISFAAGFAIAALWGYAFHLSGRGKAMALLDKPATADWVFLNSGGIPAIDETSDLALMNLRCCPEIGSSTEEIQSFLKVLDEWTQRIAAETSRNFSRYQANPGELGSEAAWRMAMISTVLGQDLGVRYDPSLSTGAMQSASNNVFFADPAKVFLQGLLGPNRTGSCSSLPVLHVALGRRLGYPMHLVSAKGHLFARWDDGKGVRVNLEPSSAGGFVSHPDEYYRTWPRPIGPEEENRHGYLKNLSAKECLAVFLDIRASCLAARGAQSQAILAAAQALHLVPNLGEIGQTLKMTLGATPQPRSTHQFPQLDIPAEPSPWNQPPNLFDPTNLNPLPE